MDVHTSATALELRAQVAAVLKRARFWGSEADILARMQKERYKITSGGYCSYLLSETFDQSLIFLPVVFDYLAALPFKAPPGEDYENDLYCACHAVASFWWKSYPDLCDTNLLDAVRSSIEATLNLWNSTFPPPDTRSGVDSDEATPWTSLIEFPSAAVFLNEILEAKAPHKETSLFEYLFVRWIGNELVPATSANLIALFLFVKSVGGSSKLFREPLVLQSTFDKDLCMRHWQAASELIETQCPLSIVNAMKKELL